MSRIGKKSIKIPETINLSIENQKIYVKGNHGVLEKTFLKSVSFERITNELFINRSNDTKSSRSYHGLASILIQNMIQGVEKKFFKILVAEGVGYKFQVDNNKLMLNMGFTHPIEFLIPLDLTIKLESPTRLSISGIDKEKVGLLASKIRSIRPPEPYKGKGIMYEKEKIIRKAGKTGK